MVYTHDSYVKSLSEFKNAMIDIKHQVIELRQESFQYQQKLEQYKQKLSKKEKELKSTVNDLQELQSSYGNLEDVCHDNESALEKAQRENSISCETICRLEKQLSYNETEIFELKKHLESYEYQLTHLEKEYHVMLTTNQSNEELYSKAQEKYSSIKDKLKQHEEEKTENEKKIKDLSERIENEQAECNAAQEKLEISEQRVASLSAEKAGMLNKTLSDAEDMKLKLQQIEVEKKASKDELAEIKIKYAAQCDLLEKLNTEADGLRNKIKHGDEQLRLLTQTQTTLNKSIDDLEISNEFKSEKIKNLEDERRQKMVVFEKLVSKLKNKVKRLELDLEMTRCELKERRKDVSELQQENLEKEFRIQSMERDINEKSILLETTAKDNDVITRRNEELSRELCLVKENQKLWIKTNEEKKQKEGEEGVVMMKMMTDIKNKCEKNALEEQHNTIVEQKQKIEELEQLWREEQSNVRAEKIEKSYLKEELDRIRVKNRSKIADYKSEKDGRKHGKFQR